MDKSEQENPDDTTGNFNNWAQYQNELNKAQVRPFFSELELWSTSVGSNIGREQNGKGPHHVRPVIILKKFNNEIFWGVPLTRKDRSGKYYLRLSYGSGIASTAILSQLKLMDAKRLRYKIGEIDQRDYEELKKRIISLLK